MSELSRDYHNLRYALSTIAEAIELSKKKPTGGANYEKVLEELKNKMSEVEAEIKRQKKELKLQKKTWTRKVRSLIIDAIRDEVLCDDLRERIIEDLHDLEERINNHADS